MVDSSIDVFHVESCPIYITNFFNDHTPLLDLVLGPSWQKCEVAPGDIHELRRLALNKTRTLGTFKRLLKDARPDFIMNYPTWFSIRTHNAARQGETEILKYMIEEEKAEVNYDDKGYDKSMFLSRYPVECRKGYFLRERAINPLSVAARYGHGEMVKFLLAAGAYPDHAIEFTAMCGSRTIMRMLWEHDEQGNDAVQGAFVIAIDREDTAMFNLLKELGAKLDDDVREALLQRAQDEGLESMAKLLVEDARVSDGLVS